MDLGGIGGFFEGWEGMDRNLLLRGENPSS